MASPDSLRMAITAIHQAIVDHQDPQAKATLATCLQNMLKVQQNDYQQASQQQPQPGVGALQQPGQQQPMMGQQ